MPKTKRRREVICEINASELTSVSVIDNNNMTVEMLYKLPIKKGCKIQIIEIYKD